MVKTLQFEVAAKPGRISRFNCDSVIASNRCDMRGQQPAIDDGGSEGVPPDSGAEVIV